MLGIETTELLFLFRQFGLAIAGAISLWGMVFVFFSKDGQKIARKFLIIFFPALAVFVTAHLALVITFCSFCVNAHEGISLGMGTDLAIADMLHRQFFLFAALSIMGIFGLLFLMLRQAFFLRKSSLLYFYGIYFICISFFMLFPWGDYESARAGVSSALHSWHSILTVGSVIVADFTFALFRNVKFIPVLERIFPMITKGIWIGLGLDFLSAGLIFDEAFMVSEKLFFNQALVGIVIINGAFLSGPLTRAALAGIAKTKRTVFPKTLNIALGVSGSISIAGWISITALDAFRSLALNYFQLFSIYIFFVFCAFVIKSALDRYHIANG